MTQDEFAEKASLAMEGEGSGDYTWLDIERGAELLEVDYTSYFPHFDQVEILCRHHILYVRNISVDTTYFGVLFRFVSLRYATQETGSQELGALF